MTRFFGVVFSFQGLAAPETLSHNAYDEWMVQMLNSFTYPTALQLLRHRPNIYTTPITDHTGVYAVYSMSFPHFRCFLSGEARQSRGVGVQPPQ